MPSVYMMIGIQEYKMQKYFGEICNRKSEIAVTGELSPTTSQYTNLSAWFAVLFFVMCMLFSYPAKSEMLNYEFLKLARFGDVAKAKEMLRSNPQIPSLANRTGDIRLIEEAMIEAAGTKNASYDFVKLMIDNGADVNAERYGSTALQTAIMHYDSYNNDRLWKSSVKLGVASKKTAGSKERLRIIDLLLKKGADIDVTSNVTGDTPLKFALYIDKKIAKLLLDAGANPNPTNPKTQISLIDTLKKEITSAEERLAVIKSLKGAR